MEPRGRAVARWQQRGGRGRPAPRRSPARLPGRAAGMGGEERGHRSRWAARRAGEGEAYPGRAECGAGGARGERRCARRSLSAARSQ